MRVELCVHLRIVCLAAAAMVVVVWPVRMAPGTVVRRRVVVVAVTLRMVRTAVMVVGRVVPM